MGKQRDPQSLLAKGQSTAEEEQRNKQIQKVNPEDTESRAREPAWRLEESSGECANVGAGKETERGFKGVHNEPPTEPSLGSCCENLVKI